MKSFLTGIAVLLIATSGSHAQTIAIWDFEPPTTPADLSNSAAGPLVVASTGSGTATGVHASAATDWTTPAGPGSVNSFSANTWAIGDFWEFSVSTTTYSDIVVSFDAIGSSTGPADFDFQYSTDGVNYTTFAGYTLVENASPNTWSSGGSIPAASHYTFDLSAVSAIENAPLVSFRLTMSSTDSTAGGTVAAGGTSRVDNFTVVSVPEPASVVMIALGLTGAVVFRRRRFVI